MTQFTKKRLFEDSVDSSSLSIPNGTALNPISTTYEALSALISGQTAIQGFYLIADGTSGGTLGGLADGGILVQVAKDANDILAVSLNAEGYFYNPDFSGLGYYGYLV